MPSNDDDDDDRLLSIADLVEMSKMSESTLRRKFGNDLRYRDPKFPKGRKIGRLLRFRHSEAFAYFFDR